MTGARAEVTIDKAADKVWALIGDFGNLSWIPKAKSLQLDGNIRTFQLGDSIVKHRLVRHALVHLRARQRCRPRFGRCGAGHRGNDLGGPSRALGLDGDMELRDGGTQGLVGRPWRVLPGDPRPCEEPTRVRLNAVKRSPERIAASRHPAPDRLAFVPAGTGSSGEMLVRCRCGTASGSGSETALAFGAGFGLRGWRSPAPPPRPR
jgi:hypothetical protein